MNQTTLEVRDFVNCRFTNLDPKTRRELRNKLRFFIPYAPHTPMYKAGYWDGFEYMFDQGGRTYINLADRIVPYLVERGWNIVIDDKRENYSFEFPDVNENLFGDKVWPKNHKHEGEPIKLRQHQIDALNTFFSETACLQELPTSAR